MTHVNTTASGIKASILRYGKAPHLRLTFGLEEARYAAAGLQGDPKLQVAGTLAEGLIIYFDHQGLALKRTQDTAHPQLETYINVSRVKGGVKKKAFVKPRYTQIEHEGRPAFKLEPMPDFAEEPLHTLGDHLPEPAQEAPDNPVTERFAALQAANGRLSPDKLAEVVKRHTGSEVVIGGRPHNGTLRLARPVSFLDGKAPHEVLAGDQRGARAAAESYFRKPADEEPSMPDGLFRPPTNGKKEAAESELPAVPRTAEDDLKAALAMVNEILAGIDPRSLKLVIEEDQGRQVVYGLKREVIVTETRL